VTSLLEPLVTRSFHAVPIIDIAGLSSPDLAERRATAARIGDAAGEVGFLYVRGHGVPQALAEGLLAAAQRLFALPLQRKMDWYIGRSANHSGYVPEGEEVFEGGKIDRKEAYDIGLDAPQGGAPMLGPNLWPDLPGFREPVAAYYAAMASLARRMFRGFALALGLPEDHFEPHRTHPPSQLRMIHYPFDADAAPDRQGIGAHTDYEFFTILHGTAPGLEVMNGEGTWVDAPPTPDALVINIGDMLEAWTNGAFVATSHRVRKVAAERYSFPFFATCDYQTVVASHPRFVSDERPARYPPIVSGEHLFAQTVKTFAYLKARRGAEAGPAFGQAARLAAGA
jgi:isopenicillin N synthase-like dioxygenase